MMTQFTRDELCILFSLYENWYREHEWAFDREPELLHKLRDLVQNAEL